MNSYFSPVHSFPLKIKVDPSFDDTQLDQIDKAVGTWNDFGQAHGVDTMFTDSVQPIPDSQKTQNSSDCSQMGTDDSSFYLIREQSPTHAASVGMNSVTPGITFRCYDTARTNSRTGFVSQVILIQDMVADPTLLTSIVLHELGHSLGLDHSCQKNGGSASFIGCSGLAEDHPYHQAVMFPTLTAPNSSFGSSDQTKEQLTDNDINRAICEYQPQ